MGTPLVRALRQGVGAEPGPEALPGLPHLQGDLRAASPGRRRRRLTEARLAWTSTPRLSQARRRSVAGNAARDDPVSMTAAVGQHSGLAPRPGDRQLAPRPVRDDLLLGLRGWQKDAYHEYFRMSRRDFLLVATPGAGKTTLRAHRRGRTAGPARGRLAHHRHADRAPQAPVGAGGRPVRHRDRLGLPERPGPGRGRLRRGRRHLRPGRRAPGAAQAAHREPAHAGHLRRDPPRGRRAVLGRRGQGGVRPGPAQARADRHAVPQRREPDPVRHLRRRTGRRQAQRLGLRLRLRAGAGGQRGPAGDLPGLLRRDALAHPGRRRDHRHPGHADDQGSDRAGLADRPGSRRGSGSAGCSRPPTSG